MPNTGKPSKDCHLCRQRRVKCDLGQPFCQRCVKYGVDCPGYREEQEMIWRNAGPSTLAQRKRKKHLAGQATSTSASKTDSSGSTSPSESFVSSENEISAPSKQHLQHQLSSRNAMPLSRVVKENWTSHSVPLLLSCYSAIDFFPGLYHNSPPAADDCLTAATHLFARAYVTTRFNIPNSQGDVALCLGRALKSISNAIQDPVMCLEDSTIIAIWVMGNYEVLIGGVHRDPETPWVVHANGLFSLLQARGISQLRTQRGRQIFWATFNIIQLRCNMTNTECPPESVEWLDFIENTLQPGEDLLLMVARYTITACTVFAMVTPIEQWEGRFEEACIVYAHCLAVTDKAELEMLQWMNSLELDPDNEGPLSLYFWNTWRNMRLKLQNLIVLMSNVAEHAPNCPFDPEAMISRRKLCREIIAATASDVIESIPICLEGRQGDDSSPAAWFDGLRMLWPLTTTFLLPTIPKELRIAAKTALDGIGRKRGIKQALKQYIIRVPDFAMDGILDEVFDGVVIYGRS